MRNTMKRFFAGAIDLVDAMPVRFNLRRPSDIRATGPSLRDREIDALLMRQDSQLRVGPL